MTPETYMKRYHCPVCDADSCPLTNRDDFPSCGCTAVTDDDSVTTPPVTCCCKSSMVEALRLLCGTTLGSLVDFDTFFFLTDSLAVGSPLSTPKEDIDNISNPSAGLRRLAPCNCDLLDVTGTAYFAVPGNDCVALEDLDQLSLCAVKAIAFQVMEGECPRDCDDSNYRRAVRAIRRAIRTEGGSTGACASCQAHCDCDDCCCAAGVLTELSSRNLSRQATLTVGPLILQKVTVLGSVGSVLVLASECLNRFYLVCADSIEALG